MLSKIKRDVAPTLRQGFRITIFNQLTDPEPLGSSCNRLVLRVVQKKHVHIGEDNDSSAVEYHLPRYGDPFPPINPIRRSKRGWLWSEVIKFEYKLR
jgi:hypothetical protein